MTIRRLMILFLKSAGLILLIALVIRFSDETRDLLDQSLGAGKDRWWVLGFGLLAYALLTAIPFVPGAEVGMALLAVLGARVAPAVYVATVMALGVAFLIGRFVPPALTARLLAWVRLKRASAFLLDISEMPHRDVVAHLLARTNSGLGRFAVKYRYLGLILLINLPGSIVIGGGGGIAMAAGLARVFHPLGFFLAIVIGVLPVPLAFLLMGK